RHFCRNQGCRTKLTVPTDNHRKAFCCPSCHEQFYRWRCKVCEREIPKGKHSKPRNCCRSKECQKHFRLYRHAYTMPRRQPVQNCRSESESACHTATKTALEGAISKAEWLARDLADARYVAEDEERLRHLNIDYEQPPAFWGDEESINLCASNSNP